MDQIRILGFAGSLRRASYNRGLARAASELAPTGVAIEVFDLTISRCTTGCRGRRRACLRGGVQACDGGG